MAQQIPDIQLTVNAKNVINQLRETSKVASSSAKTMSDQFDKSFKKVETTSKKSLESVQKNLLSVKGALEKIFSPLGIGLSITSWIRQAHQMNQTVLGWHNNLRDLSNEYGNTNIALKTQIGLWGRTHLSMSGVASVMKEIGSQGLPVTNKHFSEMSEYIANVSWAAGISSSAVSKFTVGMHKGMLVSLGATKQMTSAIFALGNGFDITNVQIEQVMQTTTNILNKMGAMFKNVDKSMISMSRGISASTAVMNKFGVSIQQSNDFFERIMDPERLNENMILFSKLGISYGELIDTFSGEGGQEAFFDRLMNNIPALSKQLQSLRDPFARLDFAKSIGLPLEIAQKMAKATGSDIQKIMTDYKSVQAADKKKSEQAKADAAKWEDAMTFLRMKALLPMMQFVQKNYGNFWKIMNSLAQVFAAITKNIIPHLQKITNLIVGFVERFEPRLTKALDEMAGIIDGTYERGGGLIEAIGKHLALAFTKLIPALWKGFKDGLSSVFDQSTLIDKIALIGAMGFKLFGPLKGILGVLSTFKTPLKFIAKKIATSGIGMSAAAGGMNFFGGVKNALGSAKGLADPTLGKSAAFTAGKIGTKAIPIAGGLFAVGGSVISALKAEKGQRGKAFADSLLGEHKGGVSAGDVASTAVQGVMIGTVFGPLGMAIGGTVGALASLTKAIYQSVKAKEKETATINSFQKQVIEDMDEKNVQPSVKEEMERLKKGGLSYAEAYNFARHEDLVKHTESYYADLSGGGSFESKQLGNVTIDGTGRLVSDTNFKAGNAMMFQETKLAAERRQILVALDKEITEQERDRLTKQLALTDRNIKENFSFENKRRLQTLEFRKNLTKKEEEEKRQLIMKEHANSGEAMIKAFNALGLGNEEAKARYLAGTAKTRYEMQLDAMKNVDAVGGVFAKIGAAVKNFAEFLGDFLADWWAGRKVLRAMGHTDEEIEKMRNRSPEERALRRLADAERAQQQMTEAAEDLQNKINPTQSDFNKAKDIWKTQIDALRNNDYAGQVLAAFGASSVANLELNFNNMLKQMQEANRSARATAGGVRTLVKQGEKEVAPSTAIDQYKYLLLMRSRGAAAFVSS